MTDTLILRRILKAPRPLIYACWTQAEHMPHWFMPKPHSLSDITIDLRPGGAFNSTMHVDGNVYPSEGCVLDAIKDRKFVFTDLLRADFQPVAEPGLGFTATIELFDHPEGTEYVVTARHRTAADAEKHEAMGFSQGWGTVATQLDAYASDLDADRKTRQLTLSRLFRASPARVWDAWTNPDILPRWFGPEGFTCVTHEIDLRPGGVWRFDMVGHGTTYPNRHRFTAHEPVSRITFLMDDGTDAAPPFEVEVTLTPEDGGTRLTQVMTLPTVAAREAAEGYNAVEMGKTTLAKLAAILGE
jgi:uncharacterized protein YndB with AHSA1/START domain